MRPLLAVRDGRRRNFWHVPEGPVLYTELASFPRSTSWSSSGSASETLRGVITPVGTEVIDMADAMDASGGRRREALVSAALIVVEKEEVRCYRLPVEAISRNHAPATLICL